MTKIMKQLDKARNNAGNLSYDEFTTLMSRCGWCQDHQRGSHSIWYSPRGHRLSVQNRKGKAKDYQVKQFLKQYDEEQSNE